MDRTKIAFCYYGCNSGIDGSERWHERMLPRLKRLGFNIIGIAYHVKDGTCRLTPRLRQHGIRVQEVDAIDIPPSEGLQRLLSVLSEELPAVVCINHVTVAALSSIWCIEHGIRFIMMIRDDFELFWQLANRFLWVDESYRVHGVVCVSRELQHSIEARTDDSVDRLYCPSSVPLSSQLASWREDDFHVVYLGRMELQQKRVDILTDLLIRLSLKWPWFSATLYGDGPDTSKVLDVLASRSDHRVNYGGLLSGEEVYPVLLTAQAVALISAHEGLSTTMQEAMACGVPVIIKRMSSGFEGVITHGNTAFVLEEDEDLESAVECLQTSGDLWYRLSRGGRRVAERQFSIDVAARRWKEFLELVAERALPTGFTPPGLAEIERSYACQIKKWGAKDIFEQWLEAAGEPGRLVPLLTEYGVDDSSRNWLLRLSLERGVLKEDDLNRCLAEIWPADTMMAIMDYLLMMNFDIAPIVTEIANGVLPLNLRANLLHRLNHSQRLTGYETSALANRLIDDYEMIPCPSEEETYNLASLKKMAGRMAEAESVFLGISEASISDARRAGCFFHIGHIRFHRRQFSSAQSALEACIQIIPEHKQARNVLAQIFAEYGDAGD